MHACAYTIIGVTMIISCALSFVLGKSMENDKFGLVLSFHSAPSVKKMNATIDQNTNIHSLNIQLFVINLDIHLANIAKD